MSVHLDNAAGCFPRPNAVREAVAEMLAKGASPGRGFSEAARHATDSVEQARGALAELIGAAPDRVCFLANATDALNAAIHGILDGGRVLTTALEHNSVLRPLRAAATSVDFVPLDARFRVTPDALEAALQDDVRLVVVHHVSNLLGCEQDVRALGRLCRARGVPFLVDAAQSVGILDVDVSDIDMLAFSGHKGLCGPPGVGVLYVAPGIKLRAWRQGGTGGHRSQLPEQPAELPYLLEAGTLNAAGIAGVHAGISHLRGVGMARIRQHHFNLSRRLLAGLVVHPNVTVFNPDPTVGIVAFNIDGWNPLEVARVLDETYGIGVGAGLVCAPEAHRLLGTFPEGAVRVSVSITTTERDVDAFCNAIEQLATPVIYTPD